MRYDCLDLTILSYAIIDPRIRPRTRPSPLPLYPSTSLPYLPQVTYACRYPGQHKPLHKPGTGEGGGRVLSDEGKLWQEKILAGEVRASTSVAPETGWNRSGHLQESFASSSCGQPSPLLLLTPDASPSVSPQAKVLSTLCLDLSFGNPLELCRGRYLSGCDSENLQAFVEAAEEVMAKSCTTTLWLEVRIDMGCEKVAVLCACGWVLDPRSFV